MKSEAEKEAIILRAVLAQFLKTVERMRAKALRSKQWYSFIPTEFPEDVDACMIDAKKALEVTKRG